MMQRIVNTSLGRILLHFSENALTRIQLTEQPIGGDPVVGLLLDPVMACLEGIDDGREIPVNYLIGTPFQRLVWETMREISFGQVRSYSELAGMAGNPRATRAVANACKNNPCPIVVPCHRVIRRDRGLGGYYWGDDMKRKLLERENIYISPAGNVL